MEPERFDVLATHIARNQASRRSAVLRLGGGVAALLATLGLGGLGVEEADARKPCKKRCKKKKDKDKRRRCKRRCRKKGPSAPGPECTGTGDCSGTDICVDNECVDRPTVGVACSDADPCDGGLICIAGFCALPCDGDEDCDGALLCLGNACVLDTECEEDADCDDPLLTICLLGLCVDDIL